MVWRKESRGILKKRKRHFWHIDYLLEYLEILGIIYVLTSYGESECKIASHLGKRFKSIENFGSSDCRCRNHLFFKPILIKEGPDEIGTNKEERTSDVPMNESEQVTDWSEA